MPAREAPFDAEVVDVAPDGALVVETPTAALIRSPRPKISLRGK